MKVLVAMSGGVDSSVCAKLLKDKGYECTGCTMKLYNNEEEQAKQMKSCCSLDDTEDARSVAYRLGMNYYVFNFQDDFKEKVIDKFVSSYENAITPNPCIDCNKYMKFERLRERALVLGCEKIATGHYARIEEKNGEFFLKKAKDPSKDQSYVLYFLTQEHLSHTLFPLGEYTKLKVRKIAEENGFINAKKPDSQDICFVADGDYAAVIEKYSQKTSLPGEFVTPEGKVLGTHKGIIHYTIGQGRGLGLSLPQKGYVCRICPEENKIVVGSSKDLMSKEAFAEDFNWISGAAPEGKIECTAKVRYRAKEEPCCVYPLEGGKVRAIFKDEQRAITPGQALVLYDGEYVLGGGTIVKEVENVL